MPPQIDVPRRFGSAAMNNLVTFQRPSGSSRDDTTGAITPEPFIDAFKEWANVMPLSGRELEQARAVQSDVTHRVRVFFNSQTVSITPRHRIRMTADFGGPRYLNITSMTRVNENRRLIELMAIEQLIPPAGTT